MSTATANPQPDPTMAPTLPPLLAPRPREMEAYGFEFDVQATAHVPPDSSVSMPIWGNALPARTIDGEPLFISSQLPAQNGDSIALLQQAGCQVGSDGEATCQPDSPLLAFGCEFIHTPNEIYPGLENGRELVATCYSTPPSEEQSRQDYLFRRGCAFRRNASHIFKVVGGYIQISSPEQLKAFFAPVESSEQALAYAQLATGLAARFDFAYDPDLLYFQDAIQGTRVTKGDQGYLINLFQFVSCLCEPWVSSEAEIMVNMAGEVTWLSARPIWMTTGFSCAD